MATEFFNFLKNYKLTSRDPNYQQYAGEAYGVQQEIFYYRSKTEDMIKNEKTALFVDFWHIQQFEFSDPEYQDRMTSEYVRYEPYFRKAIQQLVEEICKTMGHQPHKKAIFQLGIYNMDNVAKIRDLKSFQLGKLISIDGTVTRTTEVKPELQLGSFKCKQCNQIIEGIE